jgi:hypothetical protein
LWKEQPGIDDPRYCVCKANTILSGLRNMRAGFQNTGHGEVAVKTIRDGAVAPRFSFCVSLLVAALLPVCAASQEVDLPELEPPAPVELRLDQPQGLDLIVPPEPLRELALQIRIGAEPAPSTEPPSVRHATPAAVQSIAPTMLPTGGITEVRRSLPVVTPAKIKSGQPRSVRTLTLVNSRDIPFSSVVITAEGQLTLESGPLAPNATMALRLPPLKGCVVKVAAITSEQEDPDELGSVDVCKVKLVRFIE